MTAPAAPSAPDGRTVTGVLIALGVVLLLPYAILGPGFFLDDWYTLRTARIDGWWEAAGPNQWAARPGAGVIYAGTFGLVHDRPLVHFLLAVTLVLAAAVLLYRISVRFFPTRVAVGVAVVWLVQANHTSLEMWPSAVNIAAALVFALVSVDIALREDSSIRADLVIVAAGVASALTYEATVPVLGVILATVALRRTGPDRVRLIGFGVVGFGAAGLWMITHWHPGKEGLDASIDLASVAPVHLGTGVFGDHVLGRALGLVVLVVAAAIAACRILPDRRHLIGWEVRAAGVGAGVIALGIVPYVRYVYSPLGLGDRLTVVSGVGGALVLVSAFGALLRWRRRIGVGIALVAVTAAVVHRADMVSTYATAADDGRRIFAEAERRFPEPPTETVVFGPFPVIEKNVAAVFNPEWTMAWVYGVRDVKFRMSFTADDFDGVPEAQRIDVFELSNLVSDRRIHPR